MKSRRFFTNTEHVGLFSTWLQFFLLSLFFSSSPSCLDVICYLIITIFLILSLQISPDIFAFPRNSMRTFFGFFKYFFFFPPPLCIRFFLGGKSGEGDFRHGSVCGSVDALRFVYILSFSLVLVAVSDSNLGLKSSYRFNCVHRLSGFGFGSDS